MSPTQLKVSYNILINWPLKLFRVRSLREGSGKKKRLSFHAKVGYMYWARVSANRTVGGGQMSKLLIGTSTREVRILWCQLWLNFYNSSSWM